MQETDNKTNWIIGIIALIVILFVIGLSGNGYGMMGSGMWIFGWLFMSLIFIALILFIVWLIKQIQKNGK